MSIVALHCDKGPCAFRGSIYWDVLTVYKQRSVFCWHKSDTVCRWSHNMNPAISNLRWLRVRDSWESSLRRHGHGLWGTVYWGQAILIEDIALTNTYFLKVIWLERLLIIRGPSLEGVEYTSLRGHTFTGLLMMWLWQLSSLSEDALSFLGILL